MKKIIVSLLVACLILLPNLTHVDASSIPNEVSIKLKHYLKERKTIPFNIQGTYQVVGDRTLALKSGNHYEVRLNNQQLDLFENGKKITSFSGTFEIKPVKYGQENFIRLADRPYLGSVTFHIENNHIVPINRLPMEDYLKGVLPSEVYPSWNVEALKAQAVAARTYSLNKIDEVITDDVGSQRYSGYIWWNERLYQNTNQAVNETKGQVLTYNGKLIDAVYSASNGGHTESNAGAWNVSNPHATPLPYLGAKLDSYDPGFAWKIGLKQQQLNLESLDLENPSSWWNTTKETGLTAPTDTLEAKVINNIKNYMRTTNSSLKDLDIKLVNIRSISVANTKTPGDRRTHGSYAIDYFVKNKDGSFEMKDGKIKLHTLQASNALIRDLRSLFGINDFKSHLVDAITLQDGVFVISGRGWGHGVGMSQYGAKEMADAGHGYAKILSFYYSHTNFENYIGSNINNSLHGENRYETSVKIAEYGWSKGFQTVVIGRGDNPVDALTGSVLAKKYDAPLLLVKTGEVPKSVKNLLASQNIQQIFVLGGNNAISDQTVANLEQYANQVTRISGDDRYNTSVQVAGQLDKNSEVIITSGSSTSPDALSIAAHAALNQIPILFTKSNELPKSVESYLKANQVQKVTIIGGPHAVSGQVEDKLQTLAGEVKRVSGADRYATSVAIVQAYDLDPRNLFFARGEEFIDALPGSVLAAKLEAPLLLTKKGTLPDVVAGYIDQQIHFIPHIHYLGGTNAISDSTRSRIQLHIME